MITKFQALVARESLADCYASDGQSVTVVKIREKNGTFTALAEYSDGSRAYLLPEKLTPSDHLLTLIDNGTYREDSMTWHSVINGRCVTEPLSY